MLYDILEFFRSEGVETKDKAAIVRFFFIVIIMIEILALLVYDLISGHIVNLEILLLIALTVCIISIFLSLRRLVPALLIFLLYHNSRRKMSLHDFIRLFLTERFMIKSDGYKNKIVNINDYFMGINKIALNMTILFIIGFLMFFILENKSIGYAITCVSIIVNMILWFLIYETVTSSI